MIYLTWAQIYQSIFTNDQIIIIQNKGLIKTLKTSMMELFIENS